MAYFIAVIIVIIVLLIVLRKFPVNRVTIFEYERGLEYLKGQFKGILEPGQYWIFTYRTTVTKVDIRPTLVSITGQEVLSADGVTLKVSLAARYEISDPYKAINKIQDYAQAFYIELQLALREIIGSAPIDTLLEQRQVFGQKLMELAVKPVENLGLKLLSVNIKDIMFPGEIKQIFAQVVKAQKEGLAALEKARGESAALRKLVNTAKLLDDNPNLFQLRLLEALEASSGHTIVLGMPTTTLLPVKEQESDSSQTKRRKTQSTRREKAS